MHFTGVHGSSRCILSSWCSFTVCTYAKLDSEPHDGYHNVHWNELPSPCVPFNICHYRKIFQIKPLPSVRPKRHVNVDEPFLWILTWFDPALMDNWHAQTGCCCLHRHPVLTHTLPLIFRTIWRTMREPLLSFWTWTELKKETSDISSSQNFLLTLLSERAEVTLSDARGLYALSNNWNDEQNKTNLVQWMPNNHSWCRTTAPLPSSAIINHLRMLHKHGVKGSTNSGLCPRLAPVKTVMNP
jgi:hypothetical protein